MANFLPKIYFSFSVPSVVFLKILNPKLFTVSFFVSNTIFLSVFA